MNTKHKVPTALTSTGIRLLRDLLYSYHNDEIVTSVRASSGRRIFTQSAVHLFVSFLQVRGLNNCRPA